MKRNGNQIGTYGHSERKIAIYVRESTKRQAEEGYNIEVQENKCIQYIQLKDFDAEYKVYKEKGKSAKTTNRKELNELKKDIKNHKICKLIVYKLDRLVRRLKGLSEIMELCEQYHVDLISVKEDFDSNTLIGRMMINFTIMLAQWEQDIISERTIEALRYASEHGSYTLGNKPPFGYQREIIFKELTGTKSVRLVPVEGQFEVVKKIFALSEDGYNNSEIYRIINNEEYLKDNEIKFDERRIEKILSNKIYCGVMVIKGEEFKMDMETVLDLERWEIIQKNRSIHFKSDEKNSYYFKGKVYDESGIMCTVDVTNKKDKQGNVKKYFYYESPTSKQRLNQDHIFNKVDGKLRSAWDISQQEDIETKLQKKMDKCVALRDKLYKMYLNEMITDDFYIEEINRLNDDIKNTKELLNIKKKDYDELTDKEKIIYVQNKINKIVVDMKTKKVEVLLN